MKRKTSLAMGGKAIPLALSLLTANLLVANTALAQDDNKNLEEVVITGQPHARASKQLLEKGSYKVGNTNKSTILYHEATSCCEPIKWTSFDMPETLHSFS